MMTGILNLWSDEWDGESNEPWHEGTIRHRVLPRGKELAAKLYELVPGASDVYHFHHGEEELLLVLSGTPILRTPEGEQTLKAGDLTLFTTGPEGAHCLRNETDQPARYMMVSNRSSPEVVEYPDTRMLSAMAFTNSQFGEPLWDMRTLEEPKPD